MKIPKNWKSTIVREHARTIRVAKQMHTDWSAACFPVEGFEDVARVRVFSILPRVVNSVRHLARVAGSKELTERVERIAADVAKANTTAETLNGCAGNCANVLTVIVGRLDNLAEDWAKCLVDLVVRIQDMETAARVAATAAKQYDPFYGDFVTDSLSTPAAIRKGGQHDVITEDEARSDFVACKHVVNSVYIDVAADAVETVLDENAWAGALLTWLSTKIRAFLDTHPGYEHEGAAMFTVAEMAERFGISDKQAHRILYGTDGKGGILKYLSRKNVIVSEKDGSSFPLCWFTNLSALRAKDRVPKWYGPMLAKYTGRDEVIIFSCASQFIPYVRKMFCVDIPRMWWNMPPKSRAVAFSLALLGVRNDFSSMAGLLKMRNEGHLLNGEIAVKKFAERALPVDRLPKALRKKAEADGTKFRGDMQVMKPCEKILEDMANATGVPVTEFAWYTLPGSDERHALGTLSFNDWWEAKLVWDRSALPFDLEKVENAITERTNESIADKVGLRVLKRKARK